MISTKGSSDWMVLTVVVRYCVTDLQFLTQAFQELFNFENKSSLIMLV